MGHCQVESQRILENSYLKTLLKFGYVFTLYFPRIIHETLSTQVRGQIAALYSEISKLDYTEVMKFKF